MWAAPIVDLLKSDGTDGEVGESELEVFAKLAWFLTKIGSENEVSSTVCFIQQRKCVRIRIGVRRGSFGERMRGNSNSNRRGTETRKPRRIVEGDSSFSRLCR